VAKRIGARLGLSDELCENLGQIYERWDGHGLPNGLKGNAVRLAVRLVTLAQDAVEVPTQLDNPSAKHPFVIVGRVATPQELLQ
jgi:response regulator RpfG family c-di-GMP phosphodiesterase